MHHRNLSQVIFANDCLQHTSSLVESKMIFIKQIYYEIVYFELVILIQRAELLATFENLAIRFEINFYTFIDSISH